MQGHLASRKCFSSVTNKIRTTSKHQMRRSFCHCRSLRAFSLRSMHMKGLVGQFEWYGFFDSKGNKSRLSQLSYLIWTLPKRDSFLHSLQHVVVDCSWKFIVAVRFSADAVLADRSFTTSEKYAASLSIEKHLLEVRCRSMRIGWRLAAT